MGEASFGKYRLIAELGHGGMADVFLAVMAGPVGSGFSKLTVIKRLRQNLAEEPEFVEMLVDEARISARLNHPNVVQTNEVGSVGAQYFLAMEYLDGQPLHRIQHRAVQYAQKAAQANREALASDASAGAPPSSVLLPTDPFPKECQYLVLVDTLAGLHHAHELADYDGSSLQIVHRDVTPHNVFVTYEGQVKVVDFGIAKAVGRASETRQGVVKGKVRYMAPEQAIGQPVDRRADIFSVGVMLWEAATGRRLWKDMDDLNIVQALVGGNVKCSPRSFDPSVPEEIDRMCVKALAHRREERYATAEEFRLDLEQYLADSGNLVSARRKLGASVSGLFDDKRTEIKAVIEKQLQALMRQVATDIKPVQIALEQSSGLLPAMSSTGANAVVLREPAEEGPTSITDAATEFYTGSTDKKRAVTLKSRVPVIAAGVAAAVAIAAIAFAKISSPTAEVHPASSAPVTETTSADVNIKVRVAPATAHISIDGAPVPTPYEARLARDMHDHLLRVEAPGFEPHVQNVRFDSDVTMVVTLTKPAPSASASAAVTAPPTPPPARWVPPVAPPKAQTSAAPTSPPTAATVPVTAPPPSSSAPHKGNGPKPDIDKGDPWGTGK
jgi:eukaryotic-like serine/threonine-protein kinase